MNWNTTDIKEISTRGRLRLFGQAWFDISTDCKFTGLERSELVPGGRYQFLLDSNLRSIHAVKPLSAHTDSDSIIALLYGELDRVKAVNAVQREFIHGSIEDHAEYDIYLAECAGKGRIDAQSMQSEIDQAEHYAMKSAIGREVKVESWISYTGNPGLVTVLWNRLQLNHEDQLKGGGCIRSRIGRYCESVPPGLIPDEIRDCMQGESTRN